MFEPVHGSAPKNAGKNIANPVGAILSVQMMLEHRGWANGAAAAKTAVWDFIREGECTQDLGGTLGTREVGGMVCRRIEKAPVL